MSRAQIRRLARLEKQAVPYIARNRREQEARAEALASGREKYFVVVANLAVLILYGHPRVGEPLTCAWRRCVESKAWQACREKHPPVNARGKESPFDEGGAESMAQYFRAYILPDLPGADETAKLNAILAKAPPWLLWFTHAEVPILFLGLKLPDLSSMCRFERPEAFPHDPLPYGAFEGRRLPEGAEDHDLESFLGLMRRDRIANEGQDLLLQAHFTPRQHLRALRMKESATTGGSASGSPRARRDDRPELTSVAALLRDMSRTSGFVPGATLPPDKASQRATCASTPPSSVTRPTGARPQLPRARSRQF